MTKEEYEKLNIDKRKEYIKNLLHQAALESLNVMNIYNKNN